MTTQTRHTEGPWKVITSCEDIDQRTIVDDNDFWIARVLNFGEKDDTVEAKANARLIAAAPDLLEALRICKAFIDHGPSTTRSASRCKETYDKALTIATKGA